MSIKNKIIWSLLLSLLIFLLTGCGNSSISKSVTTVQEVTNRSAVASGWMAYEAGGYSSAKVAFASALENEASLDDKTKADLYNGLGWATVKTNGFQEAGEYFDKATKLSDDAKVGMAGYYLSTMNSKNFSKGISLLEGLNLQNVNYVYEFKNNTGVTNAQVHALLGVLYYLNGDLGKAEPQFRVAGNIINEPSTQTQYQIVNAITTAFSK
ncbi:MAG: hypothetical protein WC002_08965 [Candidatus Muiribacteriota bacterium]